MAVVIASLKRVLLKDVLISFVLVIATAPIPDIPEDTWTCELHGGDGVVKYYANATCDIAVSVIAGSPFCRVFGPAGVLAMNRPVCVPGNVIRWVGDLTHCRAKNCMASWLNKSCHRRC